MKQLLKEAFQKRKNQDFQNAVDIYEQIWKNNPEIFTDWDAWSYVFSLSKLNAYQKALERCQVLYRRMPASEMLKGIYAKAVFYTQFKSKNEVGLDTLRKAAKAVIKLSPPHLPYSYAPATVFALIKRLLAQLVINWEEIESWLNTVDPDLLRDKDFGIKDGRGKNISLASPKEEWYSLMIRAKAGLNQPAELLKFLELARKQNLKWHYNNDIWFARKEAFALLSLGNREKAEKILRRIISQKRDWFLLYDLALVVEDTEEKLLLMSKAALSPGKTEHKIKLFQMMYHLLKNTNPQTAKKHLKLALAVRTEQGWSVSDELKKVLLEEEITLDKIGNSSGILRDLKPYWRQQSLSENTERKSGVVASILPSGKSGFIVDGRDSWYFNVGLLANKIKTGDRVTYELADGFDKKKNKAVKNAVNIQVMK